MQQIWIVGKFNPASDAAGGTTSYNKNLFGMLDARPDVQVVMVGWLRPETAVATRNFVPLFRAQASTGSYFSARLLLRAWRLRIPRSATIYLQRPDHVIPFLSRKNPVVCCLHGANIRTIKLKFGSLVVLLYQLVERVALWRVNHVVAVSQETADFYCRRHPLISKKITVIPPGVADHFRPVSRAVAAERLGLDPARRYILYVGRIEKEKNVTGIIESVRHLSATLLIVGNGTQYAQLSAENKEYPGIVFVKHVRSDVLPFYYSLASVVVLMSLHEGMPTALLESLSCGTPIVSTNVGDVARIAIDGKTGYLATKEEFARRVAQVLDDPERFRDQCLRIAAPYRWTSVAERIAEVCQNLHKDQKTTLIDGGARA